MQVQRIDKTRQPDYKTGMSKSPIVFLCAMHSEWEAVSRGVEQAGAQERARVVHTGMGMLRAAHGVLDAWHRMADFAQCKVISAGLCGVLEHGREPFSIGEVVTPAKVCSEPMIPQELIESGFAEKVHPTEFELGFIPQIGNGEGTAHCLESAWKFVERPPTRNAHLPGRVVDM